MSLNTLTIKKFHDGLLAKKFSALEVAQTFFANIKEHDPEIGAYLNLNEENAMREAETVDAAVAKNESVGMLAGVPLAVKDNILIKGQPATAGSKILEHYTASYDAGVIKKLKNEKAIFLGKTNMDEFAMGSSTENSAFQITKNPRDPERVPGGSSGGSAAAVTADLALAGLGSDTGGSIRQPASFCGVVGLKPTYGAVSRSGLIAMASSLDQIGPLTKTVEDAAIIFDAIRGHDPLDSTSADTNYGNELLNPDFVKIKELTIGVPEEYFVDGLNNEVKTAVESARKTIEGFGVKFKKISLPHTKYALSTYYIIMPAEVSANLARFDGIRYEQATSDKRQATSLKDVYFKTRGAGFGQEAKRRIILGTFVLSSGYYDAYYKKAQQIRTLIKNDFDEAFKEVDAILAPVAPTPAFKIGEKTEDPLSMYLSDIFTIPVNLAGLPALAIPARNYADYTQTNAENFPRESASSQRKSASLPIGFQLIGKPWREADILGLGQYYERTTIPEFYSG
ncbi:MAG: Asp-tRNA(Asn)/Glu-tRNA(Gln) amidotransferase subunit GatA [Candidatus Liptonbacteria bacterium]|nr:Asp-tRNA(Asn)/Glu-tRNA(Gln) amidotransferase subunit GatA [Candidatus Liptonbacteria bacterium]